MPRITAAEQRRRKAETDAAAPTETELRLAADPDWRWEQEAVYREWLLNNGWTRVDAESEIEKERARQYDLHLKERVADLREVEEIRIEAAGRGLEGDALEREVKREIKRLKAWRYRRANADDIRESRRNRYPLGRHFG